MITYIGYALLAVGVLTFIAHALGPKPRFMELPGPFDWIFGLGAIVGGVLLAFGL